MTYPLTANAELVRPDEIEAYLSTLFEHVDWAEGGIISLLGVGEKGTLQEGKFKERKFIGQDEAGLISMHAKRWGAHEVATFIVPAVIHSAAQLSGDVTLDKIKAFTALVVDIDSGDIPAKRAHAERYLGKPTMAVWSGGETAGGEPKMHLYWRFTEPSTDIDRIGAARKVLAAKIGGDQAFGRATQIIRLPGSVHAKGGTARRVVLMYRDGPDCEEADLLEAIASMPAMEGEGSTGIPVDRAPNGMMDFSAYAGQSSATVGDVLTHTIAEGGDGDQNRWLNFSRVAGLEIANARKGLQSLPEAWELTLGWTLAKMDPPWPLERIQQEFAALVRADVADKGPFALEPVPIAAPAPMMQSDPTVNGTDDLISWAVHRRVSAEAPKRRVLVEGMVFSAKRHMVVAEGGAGKTNLCLDLALKLAASEAMPGLKWMGQAVLPEAHGGTVIIMTGEDDQEELDIRWHVLDPTGAMIRAAGDKLIALPLDNLGGAFPLVAQHPHTREAVASAKWVALFRAIEGVKARGGKVSAVIIDTLNSTLHGEENSAQVIGEYVRAISPVCGELGAALIVTHHVRKAGAEPIKTLEDMRDAIRGSTALPNAMRLVIGIWAAHNYERKMRQMGLPPARATLFYGGVVKANMPEALRDAKTLLRLPNGLLEDVTSRDVTSRGPNPEAVAWLVWAVKYAADARAPFSRSGANGPWGRRSQLPPMFHNMSRDSDFNPLIDWMLEHEFLSLTTVANGGNNHSYLDTPADKGVTRTIVKTQALTIPWKDHFYDHGWDQISRVGGDD